jgi:hypothetical protein
MRIWTSIGLLLATLASALPQTVIVDNRMAGYAYNSPYNRLYSLRSQVDFTGIVTGVQTVRPMPGMDPGVTLLVKNDNGGGTAVVELGPQWFVDRQVTRIKPKQRVQVIGSKVMVDGRGVILAKLVRTGKEVLALRRVNGVPYWDIAVPVALGPDPNVYEITGTVNGVQVIGTGPNATSQVTLQTAGGLVTVDMGPQWFWQPQQVYIANGTSMTVTTGGTFGVDPYRGVVPVYWFQSGTNTYFLRNPTNGMGIWQGWRPNN